MPRPKASPQSPQSANHPLAAAATYDLLRQEFAAFEAIPAQEASWQQRKDTVRNLEGRVQAGTIALTSQQFEECRNGNLMLGRILAYLLVAHNKTASDLEARSKDVRSEWLRIQAKHVPATLSRMPLHYVLEAYLVWLRLNRNSVPDAAADATLLQQIYDALDRRPGDDQQPKNVIKEIQALIARRDEDATASSVVVAAKTSGKYAFAGVVFAGVIGTVGVVIANWDKLAGPKPSPPAGTPTQISRGAQSPNVSGARDVTIQYGTAAKPEVPKEDGSNVAGKWWTNLFTNAYEQTERSRLMLEFVQQGDTLLGTVTETDADGKSVITSAIVDGKIVGKTISFYTRGEVTDATRSYRESYFGTVNRANNQITFKRFDDLPSGGVAETFAAKRR